MISSHSKQWSEAAELVNVTMYRNGNRYPVPNQHQHHHRIPSLPNENNLEPDNKFGELVSVQPEQQAKDCWDIVLLVVCCRERWFSSIDAADR